MYKPVQKTRNSTLYRDVNQNYQWLIALKWLQFRLRRTRRLSCFCSVRSHYVWKFIKPRTSKITVEDDVRKGSNQNKYTNKVNLRLFYRHCFLGFADLVHIFHHFFNCHKRIQEGNMCTIEEYLQKDDILGYFICESWKPLCFK